jgi:hypothetical protein
MSCANGLGYSRTVSELQYSGYLDTGVHTLCMDGLGYSTCVPLKECYVQSSFSHTIYYSAVLLIVLHETIFYPVFQRCLPQIESLQKVLIGMLLQITRVLVLMTYIIVLRHTSKEQLHCLFTYADNDHSTAQIITFMQPILDYYSRFPPGTFIYNAPN